MTSSNRFPKAIVNAIRDAKILGIRAGTKPHRIIGIWAVVVEDRVFVRSWSQKPRSWYRTFLEEPRGVIEIEGRQIPVRPIFTRSERLKTAVDALTARSSPRQAPVILSKASRRKSAATRLPNSFRCNPQITQIDLLSQRSEGQYHPRERVGQKLRLACKLRLISDLQKRLT